MNALKMGNVEAGGKVPWSSNFEAAVHAAMFMDATSDAKALRKTLVKFLIRGLTGGGAIEPSSVTLVSRGGGASKEV